MPRLVGFSRFAALLEEQISEKIRRRILSGDQGEVIDFFAPPRDDFLVGGKPAYMRGG